MVQTCLELYLKSLHPQTFEILLFLSRLYLLVSFLDLVTLMLQDVPLLGLI